jgi:hypothetical protein
MQAKTTDDKATSKMGVELFNKINSESSPEATSETEGATKGV